MTIKANNQIFTDNSKDAFDDAIFVLSKQNEKFLEDAKNSGCQKVIKSSELKEYFDFSGIEIVGITGTNGKTTTAAAIYSLLLDLGYKVALQGTRGFFINDEKIEDYSLTTPVQLENFAHIYQAKKRGCQFFVMEVSSHAIVQKRAEGLDFSLKIHTNITRDHLDYHKTIEEYINVKNSFFDDESRKLINKDDKLIKFNPKNAFSYGLDNPATYKVQAYSFQNGTNVVLQNIKENGTFSSCLMGLFNIYNLTAAIGATHILTGKNFSEICDCVEDFGGVSGRMEVISFEPYVIIDFAHTPDGMEKVLESFKHKSIICLFGAGGDRDKEKRPLMGRVASNYAKHIVVTSDNPRHEDPDLIVEDILRGIPNKENLIVEINRKEAIKKAIKLLDKDSVLLILGKGDEEYQIIYDKKLPFSDKKIVQSLIN